MFARPHILLPAAAALALGLAAPAFAKTIHFKGSFGPEGTVSTHPTGALTGTLNTTTDKVTYKITYAGLSGPVTAAHFHGPSAAGSTAPAPVMLPIPGPYHSGMKGSLTANAATAKAIEAGQTYVNLHTAANPAGEAKAQANVSE